MIQTHAYCYSNFQDGVFFFQPTGNNRLASQRVEICNICLFLMREGATATNIICNTVSTLAARPFVYLNNHWATSMKF